MIGERFISTLSPHFMSITGNERPPMISNWDHSYKASPDFQGKLITEPDQDLIDSLAKLSHVQMKKSDLDHELQSGLDHVKTALEFVEEQLAQGLFDGAESRFGKNLIVADPKTSYSYKIELREPSGSGKGLDTKFDVMISSSLGENSAGSLSFKVNNAGNISHFSINSVPTNDHGENVIHSNKKFGVSSQTLPQSNHIEFKAIKTKFDGNVLEATVDSSFHNDQCNTSLSKDRLSSLDLKVNLS